MDGDTSNKLSRFAVEQAPVSDADFNRWREEAVRQTVNPPAGDQKIAAFSAAHAELLRSDEYRADIAAMMGRRLPRLQSWYAQNLWLRGHQHGWLYTTDPDDYPYRYNTKADFKSGIYLNLTDPEASSVLNFDMLVRHTQSNVAERYKTLKLVWYAYRDQLPEAPRILDVGCSQNQGLKKLALQDPELRHHTLLNPAIEKLIARKPRLRRIAASMGYEAVSIELMRPHNGRHRPGKVIESHIDAILHDKIKQPFSLGSSLGVDIAFSDHDVETKQWVRSCSFYPSELLDHDLLERYDAVDQLLNVEHVDFAFGDITDASSADSIQSEHGYYDIVFVSFVAYMLDEQKRQALVDNALSLLNDNGLVVMLDHAEADPHDSSRLEFPDDWSKQGINCRTFVIEKAAAQKGYQEFCAWDNGRCRKLFIAGGHTALVKALL